jgi:integrase
MPLTDKAIRALKPGPKTTRVFDERGLYLELTASGGRWWRFKYRYAGKEKRLALGVYPDVPLKEARDRREEARRLLRSDIDPSAHRKAAKASRSESESNSFELITREWYVEHAPNWAESHRTRLLRLFERDVFPYIGRRPISEITPKELLEVVRRIEVRVQETAHRALWNCGQVFRYAVKTGRLSSDPSQVLRGRGSSGALSTRKGGHFAATTDPKRLGAILCAMDGYIGTPVVAGALRLAPLVFVRPGELRRMMWEQIDWDAADWRYLVTKTQTQHVVPLSSQAIATLRSLQPLTGNGLFVFPSARSGGRPMSDNAVLVAMRTLGITKEEMTGHGFRAVARTILDEVLGFRPDFIEHQLAHAVRDPNGRAYNRTAHLSERHRMMQTWADHLDTLKMGVGAP